MLMADTNDVPSDDAPSWPEYMLTTTDNPYDPFTQFDDWYVWDQSAGYCTPGLLARVARTSTDLSDADQHVAIQQAIEEIVRENVSGVHTRVKKDDKQTVSAK